jgi:hypothetical protein
MIVANLPQRSLILETKSEVVRHKWIESEKAGSDLGHAAVADWVKRYWDPFLRQRWVEHLLGQVFWHELEHSSFGSYRRLFEGHPLAVQIINLYKSGGPNGENLGIIQLAHEQGWPMNEVFQILEILNINGRRMECQFQARLIMDS